MAKTCLLCGEAAADDAATCPNDGEASWGAASVDAAADPAAADGERITVPTPIDDADTDQAPKPKTKRGAK